MIQIQTNKVHMFRTGWSRSTNFHKALFEHSACSDKLWLVAIQHSVYKNFILLVPTDTAYASARKFRDQVAGESGCPEASMTTKHSNAVPVLIQNVV